MALSASSSACVRAPRILIIRLSALGDVVMCSGLITALRSIHPDAHLAWLTEPPAAPLLAHNPRLDAVIVWPKERWKKLWKQKQRAQLWQEVRAFRQTLQDQHFDLVLDTQGLLKSGVCAWFTGAPRRVSISAREGSRWLVHERLMPRPDPADRMGSEYRQLAMHLGASDSSFQPDLAIGDRPRQEAQSLLALKGIQGPYVVLAPFTTRPQKHWFEDRWAELARRLMAHGLQVVMLGGPADQQASQRMAGLIPGLVDLTGLLPLDSSAAVVEGAALLIGVDTGLTHMGSALKRPTLALFGSTRPYLNGGTASTRVLHDALPCAPCRRHPTCDGRFDCMRDFTVDRVEHAALALLEGRRS